MLTTAAEVNETRVRINTEANRVLDAATQDYERARAVVQRLTNEVSRQQERAANEQIDRVKLRDLERKARVDGDLHTAFLRFTREAVERSTWREAKVQVVADAAPAERPAFPDKRMMLFLGLVGSTSLASLAGIGTELRRRRRTLVDPVDLGESTGLIVQGAVPLVRGPAALPSPGNLVLAVEEVAMKLTSRTPAASLRPGGRVAESSPSPPRPRAKASPSSRSRPPAGCKLTRRAPSWSTAT